MGKHSTLVGGSTAERFIECLGWDTLAKKLPKQPPGPEATRGSALHEAMEFLLEQDADYDPYAMAEQVMVVEGEGEVTITDELIANKLEPCLVWFDDVLGEADFYVEKKVAWQGELKNAWGLADIIYRIGDVAGVADWKFGDNVNVDAEESVQCLFYLGAAIDTFPEFFEGVTEYRSYIIQPTPIAIAAYRDDDDYSNFVSSVVHTKDDIEALRADLIDAKQCRDRGELDTTIGDWCKFCPAKPICPSYRERGVNAVKTPVKDVRKFAPDELGEAYLEALEVARWAAGVKKYVKELWDAGHRPTGLKRVVHRNNREWTDEKYVTGVLRRKYGLKTGQMYERTLLSPAKMEKLVKTKLDAGRKPLVVERPGAFAIVPEDDPREAVVDDDAQAASNMLGDALAK